MLPVYLIHWNAPEWCSSAARSIATSEPPVSLSIVDNGGLGDLDDVRILRMTENVGFTGGANAALRDWLDGNEPWIVIGSHDLHVQPDTFARMLADSRPGVGIIGPTLEDGSGGGVDERGEPAWLAGTCLMIRRQCAEEVGFFDELFGSYVEDVDYVLRARDAGWRVVKSTASATGRGTSIGDERGRRAIRGRSLLLQYKRNGWRGLARQFLTTFRYLAAALRHAHWGSARADALGMLDGVGLCAELRRRTRGR